AQISFKNIFTEFIRIDEIAVMRQRYTVRRVDVERLSQSRTRTARRWIAHMTNPHIAQQALHMSGSEYILHQAIGFLLTHPAILTSDHASGILSAVLQDCQRIVNLHIHITLTHNTYNAAHKIASITIKQD